MLSTAIPGSCLGITVRSDGLAVFINHAPYSKDQMIAFFSVSAVVPFEVCIDYWVSDFQQLPVQPNGFCVFVHL